MEKYTEYVHTVQYYETDRMGITHHSNYIRWMEEARVDYLIKIGWDYARFEKEGIVSPVLNLSCEYKRPTTFSDRVIISTGIKEFNGVKLRFSYEMKNGDGIVVCTGSSQHAFLNGDGRPVRIKQDYPELFETINRLLI